MSKDLRSSLHVNVYNWTKQGHVSHSTSICIFINRIWIKLSMIKMFTSCIHALLINTIGRLTTTTIYCLFFTNSSKIRRRVKHYVAQTATFNSIYNNVLNCIKTHHFCCLLNDFAYQWIALLSHAVFTRDASVTSDNAMWSPLFCCCLSPPPRSHPPPS